MHARRLSRLLSALLRSEEDSARLTERLYATYFIGAPTHRPRDAAGEAWFVAELTARCAGHTTWEPGFTVTRRARGGAFVERDGLGLWIPEPHRQLDPVLPERSRVRRRHSLTRPSSTSLGQNGGRQEVAVRVPCARENALPGYFTVVSRAGRLDASQPHLKFYVHATPAGAVALLGQLLELDARFEAKTLNHPQDFARLDTLLVYAEPRAAARIARLLRSARPSWLEEGSPPMTLPLGRGLSIAESPGHDAESFGEHRCRLIAEGLVTARVERRDALTCVAERFQREGLDWDAPWLGDLPRGWVEHVRESAEP